MFAQTYITQKESVVLKTYFSREALVCLANKNKQQFHAIPNGMTQEDVCLSSSP